MVIRHAAHNGYSIDSLLYSSRKRPRSSGTSIAVLSAVAFAHACLAVYLYDQHFTASRGDAIERAENRAKRTNGERYAARLSITVRSALNSAGPGRAVAPHR